MSGIDLVCGVRKRRDLRRKGRRSHARMRIGTLRRHRFALPGFITVPKIKALGQVVRLRSGLHPGFFYC